MSAGTLNVEESIAQFLGPSPPPALTRDGPIASDLFMDYIKGHGPRQAMTKKSLPGLIFSSLRGSLGTHHPGALLSHSPRDGFWIAVFTTKKRDCSQQAKSRRSIARAGSITVQPRCHRRCSTTAGFPDHTERTRSDPSPPRPAYPNWNGKMLMCISRGSFRNKSVSGAPSYFTSLSA